MKDHFDTPPPHLPDECTGYRELRFGYLLRFNGVLTPDQVGELIAVHPVDIINKSRPEEKEQGFSIFFIMDEE